MDGLKARLYDILKELLPGGLAIACSGGLDSRFLSFSALSTAKVSGLRPPLLFHVAGPHMPRSETARAEHWAHEVGADMRVIHLNPLTIPEVAVNDRERCYFCKLALFTALGQEAAQAGFEHLADGSNASDRGSYRPGMRALAELRIRSPLDEAGLHKADIHTLAASTGLSDPQQRPRPCLLTRLPYDMPVTEAVLRRLEEVEGSIEDVFENGPDFRVRVSRNGLLVQIEPGLTPAQRQALVAQLACLAPEARLEEVERVSGHFDRQ